MTSCEQTSVSTREATALPLFAVMPFLTMLLWVAGPARAQPEDASRDQIVVTVNVDDRRAERLDEPMLHVAQPGLEPTPLLDDGSTEGDVPSDRVFAGRVSVQRSETLEFSIVDGGATVGTFEVVLPVSGRAHFALRTASGTRALLLDLAATPPPVDDDGGDPSAKADPEDGEVSALVVQAAPVSAEEASTDVPPDKVRIRVMVDDRAIGRLIDPVVTAPGFGVEGDLKDDGAFHDEVAGDRVYSGRLDVARAERMAIRIMDGGALVGALRVFLPSTGEALIFLRTIEEQPGIALASEPVALGAAAAPTSTSSDTASALSSSTFSYVLWSGIVLFAIGFAYLRTVIQGLWAGEVRPLLRRLEKFLDNQERPP